ncbi:putative xyloglucan-specific endo-beta-1,4-glucanase A [Aspergillus avenaceus]|uniref:xyloglucan-specific endo-beta-1,4-glucanase n=1 Tax=Aspergillus avenaceus TaxID=36643 RepID=A0A5N6TIR5_ASPAV|nr:putative xyloglucan-specific endo-beta-1,4-glucanase A [Aspergillus avenaceus]
MKFTTPLLFTSLASAAALRRSDMCGQWDTTTTSKFTLYNNLWGSGNADSGSQCTGLDSDNGNAVSWHTSWDWTGGAGQVKSFANVAYDFEAKQLSSISKIPSTWKWTNTGSNVVADVAYDLFTSSTADGDEEYEVMIWLGALGGAGPISSTGSAIATPNVAGQNWSLYKGPNGQMTVFSFVAPSSVENFSADLNDFLTYLQQNQGLSSSQYLTHVQAGTEPFSGSNVKFTTSTYSVTVA